MAYERNFLTQVLIRADFTPDTPALTGAPDPELDAVLAEGCPVAFSAPRTRNEIRIEKTPRGPVRNTRTISFTEYNRQTEDKQQRTALCSEYLFVEQKGYDGFAPLRDRFCDVLDAVSARRPELMLRRLGMRYINNLRLPEPEHGPGLGADFWEKFINPSLLGGLRFAANDGALARHMCTTELNYGTDRATFRYGIFNAEYPRPNCRREFILDIDTFRESKLSPAEVEPILADFHRAACQVFETAVTDRLRAVMNRA